MATGLLLFTITVKAEIEYIDFFFVLGTRTLEIGYMNHSSKE